MKLGNILKVYLAKLFIIPCKSNKINHISFDKQVYKERHLIKNFFSKIKHFKRVFSRFDKTISAYIGMIKLAFGYIEKLFCAQNLINILL